jgi:hypothetical protein
MLKAKNTGSKGTAAEGSLLDRTTTATASSEDALAAATAAEVGSPAAADADAGGGGNGASGPSSADANDANDANDAIGSDDASDGVRPISGVDLEVPGAFEATLRARARASDQEIMLLAVGDTRQGRANPRSISARSQPTTHSCPVTLPLHVLLVPSQPAG